MDVRTVAGAVDVPVGTINAWVSRDLVPGAVVGQKGRPREFSLDQAVHLGLMAELIRNRFSATKAAKIAADRRDWKRLLLCHDLPLDLDDEAVTIFNPDVAAQLRREGGYMPAVLWFESEKQIIELFKRVIRPPTSYTVINVEQIEQNMRRAEEALAGPQ